MPDRPRIHSRKARHDWTTGVAEFGAPSIPMLCTRCGQKPSAVDPEQFKVTHATGCAGRRFRGWYRRGDEVDIDVDGTAMRAVFLCRRTWRYAYVRFLPQARGDDCLVYVADLRPVLAGPVEAEKRRLEYLRRTAAADV